jgi:hypothetical protein
VCECINECGLKREEEGRNEGRKDRNKNEWRKVRKKEIKHERCTEQRANIGGKRKWEGRIKELRERTNKRK